MQISNQSYQIVMQCNVANTLIPILTYLSRPNVSSKLILFFFSFKKKVSSKINSHLQVSHLWNPSQHYWPPCYLDHMLCRVIIWSINMSHESQLDHYVYQEIILHGNPVMLQSYVINFKCWSSLFLVHDSEAIIY